MLEHIIPSKKKNYLVNKNGIYPEIDINDFDTNEELKELTTILNGYLDKDTKKQASLHKLERRLLKLIRFLVNSIKATAIIVPIVILIALLPTPNIIKIIITILTTMFLLSTAACMIYAYAVPLIYKEELYDMEEINSIVDILTKTLNKIQDKTVQNELNPELEEKQDLKTIKAKKKEIKKRIELLEYYKNNKDKIAEATKNNELNGFLSKLTPEELQYIIELVKIDYPEIKSDKNFTRTRTQSVDCK